MKKTMMFVVLCMLLIIPSVIAMNGQDDAGLVDDVIASTNNVIALADGKPKGNDISVTLNGEALTLDARTIVVDQVSYVPMRSLLTTLGADVQWDETTGWVTATHNGTELKVRAGETSSWKNGEKTTISHPPIEMEGRTYVSLRYLNESFGAVVKWHASTKTAAVYYPDEALPRIGTYANLQALAQEMDRSESRVAIELTDTLQMDTAPRGLASKTTANQVSAPVQESASDYSSTNIQVQGVDEADLVKTDGTYIYQVVDQEVILTRAYPGNDMMKVSMISFQDQHVQPVELYVDGDHLVVIGNSRSNQLRPMESVQSNVQSDTESKKMIYPPQPSTTSTKMLIYDISVKQTPKLVREAEMEGRYLSSRKIGASLYFMTNQFIDYYRIMDKEQSVPAPVYKDSAIGEEAIVIDYEDIYYFPDVLTPNYLHIGGLNLEDDSQQLEVQTYLGSGQSVYASADHLYVAITRAQDNTTDLYKFALSNGFVTYMAKGEVPGRILNQFSMDEHEGNFRIATTTGEMWRTDERISKNNLYVLDEKVSIIGKVEEIAPGEQIYSVRFMGDRAYMVTFKTVDPLFVIDVSNPEQPTILGALKIPGYSDYLHPYDENHLIGFGKDTVEVSNKDAFGREIGTTAYVDGLKVAMFDVSDVANPKELHKLTIGVRGTDSALLRDHKALLFSKEKNLMAFPVRLYEEQGASQMPSHGQFTYQGAYVYEVDIADGFSLKDRITHLNEEMRNKAGVDWYDSEWNIKRILYMDDTLYTLSNRMIQAHTIDDLEQVGQLEL